MQWEGALRCPLLQPMPAQPSWPLALSAALLAARSSFAFPAGGALPALSPSAVVSGPARAISIAMLVLDEDQVQVQDHQLLDVGVQVHEHDLEQPVMDRLEGQA